MMPIIGTAIQRINWLRLKSPVFTNQFYKVTKITWNKDHNSWLINSSYNFSKCFGTYFYLEPIGAGKPVTKFDLKS